MKVSFTVTTEKKTLLSEFCQLKTPTKMRTLQVVFSLAINLIWMSLWGCQQNEYLLPYFAKLDTLQENNRFLTA